MAIVIKVKADTKELEKDIQQAAESAKKALNQATASAGTGASGIGKITEEFKRQRAAAEDLGKRVEALKQGNQNLGSSLIGLVPVMKVASTAIAAVATAAIGAAAAFIKMGTEGSKLADTMLETAFATGKTVEQIQKLEKGGRDLTPQLKALGGVLSFEMIDKASKATDQFRLLEKQLDSVRILVAGDMSNAFTTLGSTVSKALAAATPTVRGFASDIAFVIESISPLLTLLAQIAILTAEFERRKLRGFVEPGPLGLTTGTSPVGAFGPALTAEQQAFAASSQGQQIAQQQAEAYARRQAAFLKLAPRDRAARAGAQAQISPQLQDELERIRRGTTAIFTEDIFQMTESIRKAQIEFTILGNQIEQIRNTEAKNQKEAQANQQKINELVRQQVIEEQHINTLVRERALMTKAIAEGLPVIPERNLPLAISGVSPITPGGIPGAPQTGGAFEAFGPIAAQARDASARLFAEVREQAIRFKESIVYTFESAFREGFERGPKAFLQATASAIRSFFSQIAAELSTGIIEMILFGKGGITGRGVGTSGTLGGLGAALGGFGGGGGGGGGGGFLGGLLGNFGGLGGGTFGGSIFGGGGASNISVAPSLSGAVGGFGGFSGGFGGISNAVAQQLGFGGAGGGAAAGGGLLSSLFGPALLGGLLGTGLGGKSIGGRILGGIGGGIAGAGVGLGLAIGFGGGGLAAGVLAATGIGLLAAPFLIGAYFLGKAKQRKADEQAADAIWVAEREQIRTLISAVNADRIEGYDALAQWSGIRSNTIAQLNQIKTQSVRESRLTNQLRDLDNSVVAELRAAVERQARRRGVQGLLVPEFQSGGRVPGLDRGYDSVMIKARPGEVVLNRQQQASIQARAGDRIFEEVGIQSFYNGGRVSAAPATPQSLHINIVMEGDAQAVLGNLIVRGVETSSGQRAIVSVIKNGRKNGQL